MSNKTVFRSSGGWARVIEESLEAENQLSDSELGEVLRQQLEAPLEISPAGPSADHRVAPAHSASPFRNLAEVLSSAAPSLEVLSQAKDFAKANYGRTDSLLPSEVSLVLYFASIVAAEVHLGKRISQLDQAALRNGCQWALGQLWLDVRLRPLFEEAMARLGTGPSGLGC
jgi:hypothetical protein